MSVKPVVCAHPHPYTKFLWFLALLFLHFWRKFSALVALYLNSSTLVEDAVLAHFVQIPLNASVIMHSSLCYLSEIEIKGG